MPQSTNIDNTITQLSNQIDKSLFAMVSQDNWYWQILFVIVTTFVINLFIRRSLNKLEEHVKKTINLWDDA